MSAGTAPPLATHSLNSEQAAEGASRSRRHKSEHKHRHRKHKHKDRQSDPGESGRTDGAEVGSGPEDGEILVAGQPLEAPPAPAAKQPTAAIPRQPPVPENSRPAGMDIDAVTGARQDHARAPVAEEQPLETRAAAPVPAAAAAAAAAAAQLPVGGDGERRDARAEPSDSRTSSRREPRSSRPPAAEQEGAAAAPPQATTSGRPPVSAGAPDPSHQGGAAGDRDHAAASAAAAVGGSSRHGDGRRERPPAAREADGASRHDESRGARRLPNSRSRSRDRSARLEARDARDDGRSGRSGRSERDSARPADGASQRGGSARSDHRSDRDAGYGGGGGGGGGGGAPSRSYDQRSDHNGGGGRYERDVRPSDRRRSPARGAAGMRAGPSDYDDRQRRGGGGGGGGGGDDRSGRGVSKRSRTPERDERDRPRHSQKARRSPSPKVDDDEASRKMEASMTSPEDAEAEEERLIEERRRRMADIKAKHQQQQALNDAVIAPTASGLARQQLGENPSGAPVPGVAPAGDQAPTPGQAADGDSTPAIDDGAMQVDDGDVTPVGDASSSSDDEGNGDGPVLDIWAPRTQAGEEAADGGAAAAAAGAAAGASGEPGAAGTSAGPAPPAAAKAAVDDMFAEELPVDAEDLAAAANEAANGGGGRRDAALVDAYDDNEGYYKFQVGELMDNNRYEAISEGGRGVFSVVVRARDRQRTDESGRPLEVAIKLIRANETMNKAALVEQAILRKLAEKDVDNRKHCIRLLRTFEYRNHSCLVFENMDLNMRELTKKYGRNVGLSLDAVAMYACQLLVALRHLKRNSVLHADIKPDNILVNARRNKVKICDFGSAMDVGDVEVTPYLVSRFYRSPEVILGLKYDAAMDMWSLGCVLYELCTGRILFPGASNNAMLKLMMDVKGPFPRKMLKKAAFVDKHFDNDPSMSFALMEDDPVTGQPIRKLIANPTVKSSFPALLAAAATQRVGGSTTTSERMKLQHLADLLDKMMALDPEKRIDPDSALRHTFVKEFLPKHGHHATAADTERRAARKAGAGGGGQA